ncbi:hypothetical protein A2630_04485 [Candidatus Woesebacteria bacterium RIFCSPHIGHO2_01_FULL_44_10]|uniref:Glycosyltransferase 2-like domain-containing protein n=1 Tax=Candidatus Woesebacteria bacterium RIFCSPLOWO2_01_FULL_44_14 TaxID=1802525 RepID=A0A1F8C3L8_9BACT|nr:MAG: hypothetical protein A2630_04485 [Candidatus Woesebacteria bacterium RIFCSPHIGHO2_01_FULL_44_10]OGM56037.1 MAG: hypothetical protein A3F62_03910 [Candidatus Woesebacteria bacterium RIFCSPHIGHO2_12_FULL_44_11]OGM70760.1 MAG: hypothetical protein A2975_02620 [Candidatus Woesebacteria bacterium RIFCSPLOWO2_01_FULL_44_14]
MVDLSIIIINYNTPGLAQACLESIIKQTKNLDYEMIVVDNGSTKKIKSSKAKIIESKVNLGFAGANNCGIREARGKYLLFLNSDTLIHDNLLKEMVNWMEVHPKVGVASCALKNPDGTQQGTGGYFPTLLRVFSWMTIQDIPGVDIIIKPFHPMKSKSFAKGTGLYKKARELDWVMGAFALVRRQALEQVGGFDEEYHMYTEEVDLFYRIKQKGWQIWYLPAWNITHIGAASSTAEFPILQEYKGIKRFYKKFYPKWQYPILRLLLRIGALGRIVLFGILEGRRSAKIYVKAFREA